MKLKLAACALAIGATTFNAYAVTAFFTGQMHQVQTVTYQMAWSCQYNYAGQTFWKTFIGNCPTSVEVQ